LTSKDRANFLLLSKRNHDIIPVGNLKGGLLMRKKPEALQGTLALMVLKTLGALGPQHGYGIARRIEQISGDVLAVNRAAFTP
jgi:PadR family transcriptional regulator PadR